jgi:periplasmic divalent cation tolerance protein
VKTCRNYYGVCYTLLGLKKENKMTLKLVYTTCGAQDNPHAWAEDLIGQGLAACVNVLPQVDSVYMWQGQMAEAQERPLIIKTRADKISALEQEIKRLSRNENPSILVIDVTAGEEFGTWMHRVLGS